MCLEFSKGFLCNLVQNPVLSQVYNFYNANFLPLVGSLVAKDD